MYLRLDRTHDRGFLVSVFSTTARSPETYTQQALQRFKSRTAVVQLDPEHM